MERQRRTEISLFRISAVYSERTIPVSAGSNRVPSGLSCQDDWRRNFARRKRKQLEGVSAL